ncbi:MAG: aminoacetone oxidase family FAD-binding enzyme [Bacilli bacterium]|nr:aminoacetone oxidase family FAD-binding enzyme [Bacilli bacterium]
MSKVVIIGGGVSGVVSAIYAKRKGNKVTILERNSDILKKLLMTGNGRCNYFNVDQSINHYHSNNMDIVNKIITGDNVNELLKFYDEIGIVYKIKNGYYYPYSNQAVSVKDALKSELKALNVEVICDYLVNDIKYDNNKFIINDELSCDKLIISTGSKAYPKTGSDGMGYKFLKNFSHNITKVNPALVQIKSNNKFLKDLSGVRCEAKVSLYDNDKLLKEDIGELQLTDYGLSGICVFNISYLVNKNDNDKYALVNFIPFISTKEEFINYINKRNKLVNNRTIYEVLEGILNKKIVSVILKTSNINFDVKLEDLTNKEIDKLATNIITYKFNITGTNSFDKSQVCSGGVILSEINPENMMSKIVDNLYVTGELLDVNGDCGGYNLTFAFISGYLAGSDIK